MPPKPKTKSESKKLESDSDVESVKSDSDKKSDKESKKLSELKKKAEKKHEKMKKANAKNKPCEYCNGEMTLYYWYKFQMPYTHGGRGAKLDVCFGTYAPLKKFLKEDLEREISKDYQILFPFYPSFNHFWEVAFDCKNYADAFPIMHRLARGRFYFMLDNKGADLADEEEFSDDEDIQPAPISSNPKKIQDDGIISLDSYSKSSKNIKL